MNHLEIIKHRLKCNDNYAFLILLIIADTDINFVELSKLSFMRLVDSVDVVLVFNTWLKRTHREGTIDDMILFHNRVFPKIKRG